MKYFGYECELGTRAQAEEAEWVGLSLEEAVEKQERIEREQWERSRVPLKAVYLEETLNLLLRTRLVPRHYYCNCSFAVATYKVIILL